MIPKSYPFDSATATDVGMGKYNDVDNYVRQDNQWTQYEQVVKDFWRMSSRAGVKINGVSFLSFLFKEYEAEVNEKLNPDFKLAKEILIDLLNGNIDTDQALEKLGKNFKSRHNISSNSTSDDIIMALEDELFKRGGLTLSEQTKKASIIKFFDQHLETLGIEVENDNELIEKFEEKFNQDNERKTDNYSIMAIHLLHQGSLVAAASVIAGIGQGVGFSVDTGINAKVHFKRKDDDVSLKISDSSTKEHAIFLFSGMPEPKQTRPKSFSVSMDLKLKKNSQDNSSVQLSLKKGQVNIYNKRALKILEDTISRVKFRKELRKKIGKIDIEILNEFEKQLPDLISKNYSDTSLLEAFTESKYILFFAFFLGKKTAEAELQNNSAEAKKYQQAFKAMLESINRKDHVNAFDCNFKQDSRDIQKLESLVTNVYLGVRSLTIKQENETIENTKDAIKKLLPVPFDNNNVRSIMDTMGTASQSVEDYIRENSMHTPFDNKTLKFLLKEIENLNLHKELDKDTTIIKMAQILCENLYKDNEIEDVDKIILDRQLQALMNVVLNNKNVLFLYDNNQQRLTSELMGVIKHIGESNDQSDPAILAAKYRAKVTGPLNENLTGYLDKFNKTNSATDALRMIYDMYWKYKDNDEVKKFCGHLVSKISPEPGQQEEPFTLMDIQKELQSEFLNPQNENYISFKPLSQLSNYILNNMQANKDEGEVKSLLRENLRERLTTYMTLKNDNKKSLGYRRAEKLLESLNKEPIEGERAILDFIDKGTVAGADKSGFFSMFSKSKLSNPGSLRSILNKEVNQSNNNDYLSQKGGPESLQM